MESPQIQQLRQQSYFFRWMYQQSIDLKDLIRSQNFLKEQAQIETGSMKSSISTQSKGSQSAKQSVSSSDEESPSPKKKGKSSSRADEEFVMPGSKHFQRKDPDFNMKQQKKNRNVMSNLCHHLFKFLQFNPQVDILVWKIIDSNQLGYSLKEFYSQLETKLKSLRTYVTEKHLRSLLFGDMHLITGQLSGSGQFYLIMRILSQHFFKTECFNSILLSNKLSGQSKTLHFEGIREISNLILQPGLELQTKRSKETRNKKEAKSRKNIKI